MKHQKFVKEYEGLSLKVLNEINYAKINNYLNPCTNKNGFFSGLTGYFYFNSKYDFSNEKLIELLFDELKKDKPQFNFYSGISGIYSCIKKRNLDIYLNKDLISIIENLIFDFFNWSIQNNNWDYLKGAIGICYDEKNELLNNVMLKEKLINYLNDSKIEINNTTYWTSFYYPNQINFGMGRGLPSILLFLLKCAQQNIKKEICIDLMKTTVEFILNNKIKNSLMYSTFPSIIDINKNKVKRSRMGWCYSDLTVSYAILKIGQYLSNDNYKYEAIRALDLTLTRNSFEKTLVVDSALLNGSSSISYMYYKFYKLLGDIKYLNLCNYWLKYTFTNNTEVKNIAGFKFYNRYNFNWCHDISFLEGLTGVYLATQTIYDECDSNWDNLLLLS